MEDMAEETADLVRVPTDQIEVEVAPRDSKPECPTDLFSEDVCGHGMSLRTTCGTCSASGLTCVETALDRDESIASSCICDGEKFTCKVKTVPEGKRPCSTSAECESGQTGQPFEESPSSTWCVRPCNPEVSYHCAVSCESDLDCTGSEHCSPLVVVADPENAGFEVLLACMPSGTWGCISNCGTNPAGALCPCADDADCGGSPCVDTKHGRQCDLNEIEEFACQDLLGQTHVLTFLSGSTNFAYACLDMTLNLCRPCVQDSDCEYPPSWVAESGQNRCVSYGDSGHFCGVSCNLLDDWCPPGYHCQDGQCVLEQGVCSCPAYHVAQQALTTCQVANEHGICQGTRMCTEEGLTPCDALTPAPESCGDQVDNDCDGATDEECWDKGDK